LSAGADGALQPDVAALDGGLEGLEVAADRVARRIGQPVALAVAVMEMELPVSA